MAAAARTLMLATDEIRRNTSCKVWFYSLGGTRIEKRCNSKQSRGPISHKTCVNLQLCEAKP